MPEKLDRCVEDVLAGWKKDPGKAPKRYKSDGELKAVETSADLKSAAFAICQSSIKAEKTGIDDITLQSEGFGPTMIGVAALNDPHITGMKRLEVIVRDGKEFIKGQVLRLGTFRHPKAPKGRLNIDENLFLYLKSNFKDGVLGRAVFLDPAHEPNKGAFGEVVELEQEGEGLFYYTDPTPLGLQSVKDREYNYSSIWMHFNWKGSEIRMSSAEMVEDDSFIPIEEVSMPEKKVDPPVTTPPEKKGDDGVLQMSREEFDELLAQAVKDSHADLQTKHDSEIAAITKQTGELVVQLHADQAERAEELRLGSVSMFIKSLSQPDSNGYALAAPLVDTIASALRGDVIDEGESNELKLSAESENQAADAHSYYRGVLERVADLCPRTVPTGKFIEARDRQPGTITLEAYKASRREDLIQTGMETYGYSKEAAAERADKILADTTEVPNA